MSLDFTPLGLVISLAVVAAVAFVYVIFIRKELR